MEKKIEKSELDVQNNNSEHRNSIGTQNYGGKNEQKIK